MKKFVVTMKKTLLYEVVAHGDNPFDAAEEARKVVPERLIPAPTPGLTEYAWVVDDAKAVCGNE